MCARVDIFVDIRQFSASRRRSRTHPPLPKFEMFKFTVSREYKRRQKKNEQNLDEFIPTHGSTGRFRSINFNSLRFCLFFLLFLMFREFPANSVRVRVSADSANGRMASTRFIYFFIFSWNPIPATKIFGDIQRPRRTQQINSTRLVSVSQALEMRCRKKEILTSISGVLWESEMN